MWNVYFGLLMLCRPEREGTIEYAHCSRYINTGLCMTFLTDTRFQWCNILFDGNKLPLLLSFQLRFSRCSTCQAWDLNWQLSHRIPALPDRGWLVKRWRIRNSARLNSCTARSLKFDNMRRDVLIMCIFKDLILLQGCEVCLPIYTRAREHTHTHTHTLTHSAWFLRASDCIVIYSSKINYRNKIRLQFSTTEKISGGLGFIADIMHVSPQEAFCLVPKTVSVQCPITR